MPITYSDAQAAVARFVGGSTVSGQLAIAAEAIQNAIRELDSRHDWEWKLSTLSDITVVAGTATYDLVSLGGGTNPKKIYSARLKGNKRNLVYVRQREVDRVIRDQEANDLPVAYTDIRSAAGNLTIKLFPTPNAADTLQVRVYEHITVPSVGGTNLDIPDRYIPAVLALARYIFLIDRDAEDARGPTFLAKAEQLISKAIQDDIGNPDEDIRFIPQSEWVGAQGPDPLDTWFYGGEF